MHATTTLRVALSKNVLLELTVIYKVKNMYKYDVDGVLFLEYDPRLPMKKYEIPMPLYEYLIINSPIDIEERIEEHLNEITGGITDEDAYTDWIQDSF